MGNTMERYGYVWFAEFDPARRPLEQGYADDPLEPANGPAERRLAQEELAGCTGEAPQPVHGLEVLELAELHRPHPPRPGCIVLVRDVRRS